MSLADDILASGFSVGLEFSGRSVTASTGEQFVALIEDVPMLPDPTEIARAKTPVYTRLHGNAGCVVNPRLVTRFTEPDGMWHRVLKFEDDPSDKVSVKWLCESKRA